MPILCWGLGLLLNYRERRTEEEDGGNSREYFHGLNIPFYAGPTMAMIAYKCPDIQVVVVDINAARIAAWNSEVRTHPPSLRPQWQHET